MLVFSRRQQVDTFRLFPVGDAYRADAVGLRGKVFEVDHHPVTRPGDNHWTLNACNQKAHVSRIHFTSCLKRDDLRQLTFIIQHVLSLDNRNYLNDRTDNKTEEIYLTMLASVWQHCMTRLCIPCKLP